MHSYAWRGRNPSGELITGVIDAEDDAAVADQLLASGVTPVQIGVRGASLAAPQQDWWQALRTPPVSLEDLLMFSRQMYTLQRAGVPILRALAGLQASTAKASLVALLADLRAGLDQGRELAVAMARHPAVFGSFYVAMIRVGEMTGRLTEVFQRLAEHLEFELDVRARIKQAMRPSPTCSPASRPSCR
jgi:MSHA biogenesis protein MshG